MVSLFRPLPISAIPRLETEGQLASVVLPKCLHLKYTKQILMMGNIGPLARFYVKIRDMQNIFYMMGYSELKMTFTLNEWAVGKQMAQ